MSSSTLVLHFSSVFYLTGLCWVIQSVHYPVFFKVDQKRFSDALFRHGHRLTLIVAPAMIVEMGTGGMLLWQMPSLGTLFNFLSVVVVWWATFFVTVPMHRVLLQSRSKEKIYRLIVTNWLRTGIWTVRAIAWVGFLIDNITLKSI